MARTRQDANSTEKEMYAMGFAPNGESVCVYCNEACFRDAAPTDPNAFQLGHVHSDANGGRFEWSNLAPMCRSCNVWLGKRDANVEDFHFDPWARFTIATKAEATAAIAARREERGATERRKAAARK